jgi:outer membrane protein assembly factor BamB/Spy/CpxP family protein refolding chaperone
MFARWALALGVGVVCLPALAGAGHWPQFRGPGGSGVSAEKQLPAEWGTDKNVVWKAKIPGYGWSSPVVWGDKVFVTTAVSDKQTRPGGFGGFGGFGGPRGGGRGGFGRPPQPGQILPSFFQGMLELTDKQKKEVEKLQKEVDGKLGKILTDKQKKQLKEPRGGFGRGRFGRGGFGGFGGFPQPGQVLSPAVQESLELSDKQKKQLKDLQKEVDGKLAKVLTDKQKKQLKDMRGGFGRGGFGRGGRGRFGRPPQPGQIIPSFLQERMELSAKQKKDVEKLQKEVDGKLAKVLTDKQKKLLKETGQGRRGGGFGRFGRGGFGGPPQPGKILSPFLRQRLELTDKQKKEVDKLQKEVDGRLAKILTEKQQKQLKEPFGGFGRGGFGRGGRGGPGGFGRRPPDTVYKWMVYCLRVTDGKVLWKKTAVQGKPTIPINPGNTYATETPVTDGKRVYAYFGMTGVFCYDLAGKFLWKKKLGSYPMAMGYGTGSSPVLDGNRLFVQCDNEEQSFLAALDAKTGAELWRTKRPERSSWGTPLVWKNKERTEVVCLGTPRVRSYDPATGKQLWELGGLNGQPKASPVASPDLLYVGIGGGPGGFGGRGGGRFGGGKPLFAVKAGASGDITLKNGARSNAGVAWSLPQGGPSTASPLLYEGRLYILEERGGILTCLDARTGKKVYKERLSGARGFTSSPWAYGGKVFCLDDNGRTFVVQAGPKFKVLHKNSIEETFWSSPAAGGGALLLRGVDHLYCIRKRS